MELPLYGLLTASRYFNRTDWQEYVLEYARMTAARSMINSVYDKSVFGYPGVNTQLCWLSEQDDCGSFGSFPVRKHSNTGLSKRRNDLLM